MAAVAAMEWNGVPIDVATLEPLRANWKAAGVKVATDPARAR
jgi:hypothetical protein